MNRRIFVYSSIKNRDYFLGTLYVSFDKNQEMYSFEYDKEALSSNLRDLINDPEIMFTEGRQYKIEASKPFHFMLDSMPDRWGRNLIKRDNKNKALNESDYLLLVSDISREGSIRYKLEKDGPFLNESHDIPTFKYINELEEIAYNYDDFSDDEKWRIILSPGSSLGGARPKAIFYNNDKELYLAKFNHIKDDYDVSKIEYFTYLLQKDVGINVSESSFKEITSKRSAFISKRFDRNKDERFPYVSFMTLLNAKEGDSYNYSYIDIAEKLLEKSSFPKDDLKELFKRIALSIIIHNYDNHLRNYGMLKGENGWSLSPNFDTNLVPSKGHYALMIDETQSMDIESLINLSMYFQLSKENATKLIIDLKEIILRNYQKYIKNLQIENNLAKRITSIIDEELSKINF